MATITVSDFFTVGGVQGVFIQAHVVSTDTNRIPTAVKIVSIAKHGVEVAVSDKERENFEALLLDKARRSCAADDDDRDDCEPEDFNDRYDARRARWGTD